MQPRLNCSVGSICEAAVCSLAPHTPQTNLLLILHPQADNENAYAKTRTGRANVMSFAADPAIFPCQLSEGTLSAAKSAVRAAAAVWGERSLTLLDAEDRLSVACEKGATDDDVLLRLRAAYQAMLLEYRRVTEQEKAEVVSLGGLHVVGTGMAGLTVGLHSSRSQLTWL
eukprot:GHUV01033713.1.p1 GENE.GHUV01033713.1~~GHUV01033713.1.p1  ORF type:complete len:170 (-),score=49.84 GHUV01033713.1:160-669(-)